MIPEQTALNMNRLCEERSDAAIQYPQRGAGLLRFARNDEGD